MRTLKKIRHLPGPAAAAVALAIRALGATLRLRVDDPNRLLAGDWPHPYIFVMWHNRILCMPCLARRPVRERVTFLASRSRDGGYISDILARFHMPAVRGSSSKGGAAAVRQLEACLSQGQSVFITPDGPRGPRYQPQPGAVWLAARSGLPIVPLGLNFRRHWELGGWDRGQIPVPFSRAELVVAPPLTFSLDEAENDLPACVERLREQLTAITRWDHPAPKPAADV